MIIVISYGFNHQNVGKSADPGRRKGERVGEKAVLHCYYYYYYDDDYYYDYYYDLVASSSFTAML